MRIVAVPPVVTLPFTWQGVAMPLHLPNFFVRSKDDGATHSEAAHIPGGRSVRDLVFGANDGLVAAFAVVSGVHGAALSTRLLLLPAPAPLISRPPPLRPAPLLPPKPH